jgi:LysM repeat protein
MSTDKPRSTPTKVCPSCGTRVSENAPRCLVCGHQFVGGAASGTAKKAAQSQKSAPLGGRTALPELRLSLPIAIGLLALFLIVGGTMTYVALAQTGRVAQPTGQGTPTGTATITPTPSPETPTVTATPQATFTPLDYVVKQGDTCGGIGFAFSVAPASIILQNSLDANCSLFIGQQLKIPQPTFTPTPQATATLGELEATVAACETEPYVVQANESLSLISSSYGVPLEAIMAWNGLTTDIAYEGQRLSIPLCMRTYVGASTVTPTVAPPYPAPELLLPADGSPFDSSSDTIALQWASVATLRNNEYYQVTIVDITGGQNRHITDEVKDTAYTVPVSFRPTDGRPHIFRWWVVTVAQIGVDSDGLPVFINGGPVSDTRVFTWNGTGAAGTPTP